MEDVNKIIKEILIDMELFGRAVTLGERHFGFIRLKNGKWAEMSVKINTDEDEWLMIADNHFNEHPENDEYQPTEEEIHMIGG